MVAFRQSFPSPTVDVNCGLHETRSGKPQPSSYASYSAWKFSTSRKPQQKHNKRLISFFIANHKVSTRLLFSLLRVLHRSLPFVDDGLGKENTHEIASISLKSGKFFRTRQIAHWILREILDASVPQTNKIQVESNFYHVARVHNQIGLHLLGQFRHEGSQPAVAARRK